MGFITNLFAGGANSLVDSVGKVLDNVITTKGEKQELENEIRKSEMQYQLDLQKLSIDERRMVIEDTASARSREVEISKSEYATKLAKNVAPYLALGTVVLTFILFYVLIFKSEAIPTDKRDVILYILGVLSATLTQIYSYYFGSSAGSAAKQKQIEGMR